MKRGTSYFERSGTKLESGGGGLISSEGTKFGLSVSQKSLVKKEFSVVDRLYGVGLMKTKKVAPVVDPQGEYTAKLLEGFDSKAN